MGIIRLIRRQFAYAKRRGFQTEIEKNLREAEQIQKDPTKVDAQTLAKAQKDADKLREIARSSQEFV